MNPSAPLYASYSPLSAFYDDYGRPLAYPYPSGTDPNAGVGGEWHTASQDGLQPPYTPDLLFDGELCDNQCVP